MRRRSLAPLVALVIASQACSQEPSAADTAPEAHAADARERAVEVRLSLAADVPRAAARDVRGWVEARGGHVASQRIAHAGEATRVTTELRVPSSELSAMRAMLEDLGEITQDRESIEDVTAAHADVGARLRNARAHEQRLLALVATETATLADVVAIERELARVREGIELLEAQDRVLADRVLMARVTIEIARPHAAPWDAPVASLSGAARFGAQALLATATLAAMCLVAVGPSATLVALLGWAAARARRALASRPAR